ncbi:MAG: hypothetical protein IJX17_05590 [Clostridia bacterium]|nr:hypothetical protein [Clostridia bacterium]
MSKNLEKLNREKKNLENRIEKISGIANARAYDFNDIYDHDLIPFIATRATLYGAGETFENVYDRLDGGLSSHTKAGQVISNGVNYAIAGAAATAIGVTAIPIALLETVYSVPVAAYQFVSERTKEAYNSRISKAKHKLNDLQTKLDNVNSQIENETQGLEK